MAEIENEIAKSSARSALTNLASKRQFFDNGATLSYAFRIKQLKMLRDAIKKNEHSLIEALHVDLRKSPTEAYISEVGFLLNEIDEAISHLREWMKPKKQGTPLFMEPSRSEIRYEPKGVVLIIAPWNYPVQLAISPLIGAIAAGNCALVKPSEDAPHCADAIEKLIEGTFQRDYISAVQGVGSEIVPELLDNFTFNHIFFTGSTNVGRIIAKQAAESLCSTTLELGGKSPLIVDKSANMKVAAKRTIWGKLLNAGQTCISPDYVLVEESAKEAFIAELINAINSFFGDDPQKSDDYPRMIHDRHFDGVAEYLTKGNIRHGGRTNREDLYIEPTIIDGVSMEDPVMKNEIFGPVLPILTFKTNADILEVVRQNRYPLACYYFGSDKDRERFVLDRIEFGGGAVNNTIMQIANADLPFGGIQGSGSGRYHGWHSFECFSNPKAVISTATWIDPSIRYPPFTAFKRKWLKKFIRF
ncbi:MAG: aldehyde dehydrogenase family protein [Flavobacteriales bacterium]|nr:aldehyde dehydrogenase family protein [Flavobacteriales bacterium]